MFKNILFVEMNFSKVINFRPTCVEMAKLLLYKPSEDCHHGKVYPRRNKPGALPGYVIPKRAILLSYPFLREYFIGLS
jgi:hypothetical protein